VAPIRRCSFLNRPLVNLEWPPDGSEVVGNVIW
jgi:hypothetical protein